MEYFLIALGLLCVLLGIRNQLAYRWRMRAIREAAAVALKRIEDHRADYLEPYNMLPSYVKLMFDLRVWSYRSPYKDVQ